MHTHNSNEHKTRAVVIITCITMIIEIVYGIHTKSMALLADGIHMGSHVLAIGLSWLAYILVRKLSNKVEFKGDSNKILTLSGYTSGLFLLLFGILIIIQAVQRLFYPTEIMFKDAILVAVIGLIINIVCAFVLHHKHEHSDHSIRAAYLHVIADALTSVTAIIGLTIAMFWNIIWIDALCALLSSIVIIKWSISLLKDTGTELIK